MTEMFSNIPNTRPRMVGPPPCAQCGGPTRLYGTEPHPRLARTDLHTYVCSGCDSAEVVSVPIPAAL